MEQRGGLAAARRADRVSSNHGGPSRRPWVSLRRSTPPVLPGRSQYLRQSNSVQSKKRLRPLSSAAGGGCRVLQETRSRLRLCPSRRGDVPGAPACVRGSRRGLGIPLWSASPGSLSRRRDRSNETLPDVAATSGVLRGKRLSATGGRAAPGARPERTSRSCRSSDGTRKGRPGDEFPEPPSDAERTVLRTLSLQS